MKAHLLDHHTLVDGKGTDGMPGSDAPDVLHPAQHIDSESVVDETIHSLLQQARKDLMMPL